MGFGNKLFRGLLTGGADYFGKVAEEERKTREADILLQREMALKRFEQVVTNENADQTLVRSKDLASHQGLITRNNTAAELGQRGVLDAFKERREAVREEVKEGRANQEWDRRREASFQDEILKMEKASGIKMSEAEKQHRLDIAKQSYFDGVNIDRWETDSDTGELVGVTRRGTVYRGSGVKPVQQTTEDGWGWRTGGGTGGGTGEGTTTGDAGETRPPNTYTAAEFQATLAEARMDPRFKHMSAQELRALVTEKLKEQGLRLAPNGR